MWILDITRQLCYSGKVGYISFTKNKKNIMITIKKVIFETIRTFFFLATITACFVFLGVALDDLWVEHLRIGPVFLGLVGKEFFLKIFKVTGAIAVVTMPIVIFGMACRSYAKRETTDDGEEIIKAVIPFVVILVIIPGILLLFQEKWEQLGYFTIYWIAVVIIGRLGKYVPHRPLMVYVLGRAIKR